jgi:putative DNA primase/helicase
MFSVYGAKSIAGIALEKHLPDATMSRGIVFNMRRKLPGELVRRLRHADGKIFERLASQLVRFG